MILDERSYQVDLHPLPSFNQFSIHEWTKLGEGYNLYDALTYAIDNAQIDPILPPENPRDHYRIKGQGDLTELKIE